MARDAHRPEEGSELDCPIPKRRTVLTRGQLSTHQEAHGILFSQSWLWQSHSLWEREADMGHRGDGLSLRGASGLRSRLSPNGSRQGEAAVNSRHRPGPCPYTTP